MQCSCGKDMDRININKNIYYLCKNCYFLKKDNILNSSQQKERYDHHICDENYLNYMKKVFDNIKNYLKEGNCLDFGCGKIHALSDILNVNGYICDYYDLFYYPNFPDNKYDNVIMIEVFEHLEDPYQELEKLKSKLNIGGRIIIHTKPYPDNLVNWWYLRDTTHISFIKEETINIWSEKLGYKLVFSIGDIFIIERIK